MILYRESANVTLSAKNKICIDVPLEHRLIYNKVIFSLSDNILGQLA